MRVLTREFYNVSGAVTNCYTLVPLGDIHIGSVACDEGLLKRVVDRIVGDEQCYWVGMGDYCEYVNLSDKRFDPTVLADWLQMGDLGDLVKAQTDRLLELLQPIAGKCLGLLQGNHEQRIAAKYERDVHSVIVNGVKSAGGFAEDHQLDLSFQGWILFKFYWTDRRRGGSQFIRGSFHHGFVGGKLAGAKALNMERWLWSHDCDFAVFGHSHTTGITVAAAESIDRAANLHVVKKRGGHCGTFMRSVNENGSSLYTERRGFFPSPVGGVEVQIIPGAKTQPERVRMMA